MKIKLIAPARKPEWGESFWELKTFVRLSGRKAAGILLALPTLAALTSPDIEISITDENVEPIDFTEKVDLVGISFFTSLAPRAYEIADEFRVRGVKVVLGGIHASMLPEEAIKHADSVVVGEAEETWPKLINDFKEGSLQKFYKATCLPDIANSPIPRWDLLKPNSYCHFTIQTGRGCPYSCDFCSVHIFNGSKYRHKKIENVFKEVEFLKTIDPKRAIFFADDNFLAKPSYTKQLLKEITQLNIRFWAQASINRLADEEVLNSLYEAGCRAVFVGFESVSQESLSVVNKSNVNNVKDYKKIIDKIHSRGIGIFGSFVVGMETDSKSVFDETSRFIRDTNIAFSMINILTPLPGTNFFRKYEDRIFDKDWSKYNGNHICFLPKHLSKEDLQDGRDKALMQTNSYGVLYGSLRNLWNKGVFVRDKHGKFPLFTKGRILFTLKSVMSLKIKRTWFILKSLWNKDVTSVTSVVIALNCYDYMTSLIGRKSKDN